MTGAFDLALPPLVIATNRRGGDALFRGGAEQDVIITGDRFALATLSPPNVAVVFEGAGIELVALAQPGDAATTSIFATVRVDANADLTSK